MTTDDRIASILGEWVEARDTGETVDPEEVIAAHPDLADELRRRFKALSLMEEALGDEVAAGRLRPLPAGRYGDFKVTGEGGMGIVYWALDSDLNRQVAFKIVRPDVGGGRRAAPSVPIGLAPPSANTPASRAFETLKARFLQEAWVTAGLEHPGIVPVYELGETPNGVPYYTMRFVRGSRTLASAIEEAKEQAIEERLTLLEPFLRVCDTIRYAHAHGVIHRDLKPDNVALGEFGEVVVLDWGLAKMKDQEDATAETWQDRLKEYREASDLQTMASALGTPGYMSPEAALGRVEKLDERGDVYSLGAMLFEILTGRLPFEFKTYIDLVMLLQDETAPPATEFEASVPEELSRICAQALAKEREDRYPGAGELAEAIRTWQRESATKREVRELLAKAEAAFGATEGLAGEALLKQLDRVTSACSRITDKVPDQPRAAALTTECEEIRKRAIAEREKAARGKLLKRVAALAAVLLIVIGVVVVLLVDARRREAEEARRGEAKERSRAEAERDAKDQALTRARVLGLVNASENAARTDPMVGLTLSLKAVRLSCDKLSLSGLHQALSQLHERATLPGHDGFVTLPGDQLSDGSFLTACKGNSRLWSESGEELAILAPPDGEGFRIFRAAISPHGDRFATLGYDGRLHIWHRGGNHLAELKGHQARILSLRYSPRGDRILTTSEGGVARLWDPEGSPVAVLSGHPDGIVGAEFLQEGERVLTAGKDGTTRLWSPNGEEISAMSGPEAELTHASPSPDSPGFLSVHADGTVRLRNDEGLQTAMIREAGTPLAGAWFLPGTDRVVAVSADRKSVGIWRRDGEKAADLGGHSREIRRVAVSPVGGRILTASLDHTLRLWDQDGQLLSVLRGHTYVIYAARFSPGGDRILTSSRDGTARLWDLRGRELAVLKHDAPIYNARFLSGGDLVLTGDQLGGATLWTFAAGEDLVLQGHAGPMTSAAFSPDGDRILTTSTDMTARLWSREGRLLAVLRGHTDQLLAGMFSPLGDRILTFASFKGDYSPRLWDREGRPRAVLKGHTSVVCAAMFSPDGRRVVTGSYDGTARIWDQAGRELHRLPCDSQVCGVAYSFDGGRILTGTNRGMAALWTADGEKIKDLPGHVTTVWRVAFSPRGDRMVTLTTDGVVRLWDAAGTPVATFREHEGGAGQAVFSPSGNRLLTAVGVGAFLWDPEGKKGARLEGHNGAIRSACFSPDGLIVLTASKDGTARLWDLSGRELVSLRGHTAPLCSAMFSPDGSLVLTASNDETARTWLVRPEDLFEVANARVTRELTPDKRALYGDLFGSPQEDGDD